MSMSMTIIDIDIDTDIDIVDESYTSKTCGSCGMLHHSLAANKIFRCKNCKVIMDRDVNGARNILIKSLI